MGMEFVELRSGKNRQAGIDILKGHFATSNSHINTYIDISTVKTMHRNSREAARVLSQEYLVNTMVNAIVCLDETEVIGSYMADFLADGSNLSLSHQNNIAVITPEIDGIGQILFRDNKQGLILNKEVIVLAASLTTGKTISRAIESVLYYGGRVCGIASIFSAVNKVAGMEVKTIFTSADIPDYRAYAPHDCPMCRAGGKVDAIVNSHGYSKV